MSHKIAHIVLLAIMIMGLNLFPVRAQDFPPRTKISLNESWEFSLGQDFDSLNWQPVELPHTWNSEDAFDEEPGYKRTIGWYRRKLGIRAEEGRKYVLLFEAANQTAEVYINGRLAGKHKGGYTAFTINAGPFLNKEGDNQIRVKVDNRHNPDIPPLKGDFNFYGGIYRDVWLLELNSVHFDFGDYAASGIDITTPEVSKVSASLKVNGSIQNDGKTREATITSTLMDPQNNLVEEKKKNIRLNPGGNSFTEDIKQLQNPQLWHPDHPHLYTLVTELKSENKILDRISTPVGFRWFRFDPDSGFYLNGSRLKLMGVNRHQDYPGKGNALSNARHLSDIRLAKESGGNFLRTAHYPQDPAVLEACDRLGLLVSMEMPLDHEITDNPDFYKNSIRMQREMIRQFYNHPSIIIWAYMNEMLLGRNWERDREHIQKITNFARELESVTREEDSTRYTMIPNHGQFDLYHKAELTDIPMIVGWNLYFGWYEDKLRGLGRFLDHYHNVVPEKPTIITEYGAGSDPRIRTFHPIRFDFSMEWQTRFLQSNLEQIFERPFVAGAAVWNLFDFGSESRRDAVPMINSKGVMTFDRKPKDSYYLLQSWLKEEPFVRIGSRSWTQRVGKESLNRPGTSSQQLEVFGNTGSAELFLNGRSLGSKEFDHHIAGWEVPFVDGRNQLEVRAKGVEDSVLDRTAIDFQIFEPASEEVGDLFQEVYINAGANFYFVDETNGIIWLPDTPYEQEYWGYVGGESYQPRNRGIGTDASIVGTDRDPLFQTQRQSVEKYRFDVPPGTYEVVLLFSNINGEGVEQRFDLLINDQFYLKDMNLSAWETNHAIVKKIIASTDKNHLNISFLPKDGPTAINGIGIRKIN